MIYGNHSEVELVEVRSRASAYGLLLVYLLVLRLHVCMGAVKWNGGQNAYGKFTHSSGLVKKLLYAFVTLRAPEAEPQMHGRRAL